MLSGSIIHPSYIVFTIAVFYSSSFIAVINSSTATATTDYGYGIPCDSDTTCHNYSLLLTCSSVTNLCECVSKSAVILDETINQCQVIAGKSCYRQKPSNGDDDYYYGPEYTYVPCVLHASCQTINYHNPNNKICVCGHSYYANERGKCVDKKDYGETCEIIQSEPPPTAGPGAGAPTISSDQSDPCNSNRYFVCTSAGKCGCPLDLKYDSILNTCYKPIGTNCTNDIVFRNSIFHGRHDMCPLNSDCIKGICQCRPGFALASDQSCQLGYGKACNETNRCSDFQFICRNGTCQCKYPLHQIYENGECLSLVPGPCNDDVENGDSGLISCVQNAECIKGQCRCKRRYKQDASGLCVKPFSHECIFDHECQAELACVNNTCNCPDLLQTYDREREACLGLIGSRCQIVDSELVKYRFLLVPDIEDNGNNYNNNNGQVNNADWIISSNNIEIKNSTESNSNGLFKGNNENGNEYSDENSLSWCIEGAECKPFGVLTQFGRIGECICLDGWVQTDKRQCVKE